MNRISIFLAAIAVALPAAAAAQGGLVYETESIPGSDIPVTYHLIMTVDGLYTPIGLRKPNGDGPFPIVLFASGNGGEGLPFVKDYSHNRGWTLDRFLDAGYAVAWLRYRAEVDDPEYDGTALSSRGWSGRPRYSRAPLEYEDVIATIEYVKTLSFVDADRVGYMGMSHGGEMLMKIASVYDGLAAGIASEPASAAFLARRPEAAGAAAESEPETAEAIDEAKLAAAVTALHGRVDRDVAMARIESIDLPVFVQGRDRDHNQPVFRVNYELLAEAGKDVRWKTYDHDLHGFAYVQRNADGEYRPDAVQREVVADSIAFFDAHLKEH
jgi:dienelactone hydrolase